VEVLIDNFKHAVAEVELKVKEEEEDKESARVPRQPYKDRTKTWARWASCRARTMDAGPVTWRRT